MSRIFLVCAFLVFPFMAQANIGDDINGLLEKFFGSGQDPLIEAASTEDLNEDSDQVFLEALDATEVRRQIFTEEAVLEQFESDIREKEQDLWRIQSQRNSAENQIYLLDTQIGFNTEKLTKYQDLEAQWKKELEQITREKSALRAEMRQAEREYSAYMSKKFVRQENFDRSPEMSILQWLFSARPVSRIVEDRKRSSTESAQKKEKLNRLRSLKKAFENKEKNAALFYNRMAYLGDQIAREKLVLQDMAEGKARLLENIKSDEYQTQDALELARDQQAESTIFLQNLRQQLETLGEVNSELVEPIAETTQELKVYPLYWPLQIPIHISATFRDKAYKAAFGRDHDGIDLEAPQGTEVYAPQAGSVKKVASNGFGYSYVILEHENDLFTVFGHVSKILVEVDQVVEQGEVIALTGGAPGTPGAGFFTSGPHLHFEVFKNGKFADPIRFLPPLE